MRPEDVVVSDRAWRWKTQPGGAPVYVGTAERGAFIIRAIDAVGMVDYEYASSGCVYRRPIAEIAAHAEPDPLPAPPPKCRPDCTPAHPCGAVPCCPAFEEMRVAVAMAERDAVAAALVWAEKRLMAHGTPAVEPPELRCGRELACGLYRAT